MTPLVAVLIALCICFEPAASFFTGRVGRVSVTCRTTSLYAKSKGSSKEDVVTIIHSHHLLDHKPDNMILSGKKYKLRGVACLGRPGVALCIGSQGNVNKFLGKLKGAMPQKKFGMVDVETASVESLHDSIDGFEEASLKELRELLTSMDAEDKFFNVVGIPQPQSASNNNSDGNESLEKADGGKSNGRKKKRKKR